MSRILVELAWNTTSGSSIYGPDAPLIKVQCGGLPLFIRREEVDELKEALNAAAEEFDQEYAKIHGDIA